MRKKESEIGGGRCSRRREQNNGDTIGYGILWFIMQPKHIIEMNHAHTL